MMTVFVHEDIWLPMSRFDAFNAARSVEWWELIENANPLDWDFYAISGARIWDEWRRS